MKDYDEAIQFYTQKFILIKDTVLSEKQRWVKVAPPGARECCLLLAKAANKQQEGCIGNQTGGRVFLFLHTDDIRRDYVNYCSKSIRFVREPSKVEYGTVGVFEDLYGNLWDLVEPFKK